ncbi:MAG TPA: triose-phosphate isomerase [bacterium]|nr:triose-phosphate isomerase [bacterium]
MTPAQPGARTRTRRVPFVAANWKMHMTREPAERLAREMVQALAEVRGVDVAICPPATALDVVGRVLKGTPLMLGAQTMHDEPKGAFTGEISAPMLLDVGCRCVILGHSERRQYFGETDEALARKVRAAISYRLIPIICVGERLAEREAGRTDELVTQQVAAALEGAGEQTDVPLVVAYEPVWAIGTGRTATGDEANRVAALIRSLVASRCGDAAGNAVRVLYGGSVKPDNIREFLEQPDVDGALVGGASLDAQAFAAIVRTAAQRLT